MTRASSPPTGSPYHGPADPHALRGPNPPQRPPAPPKAKSRRALVVGAVAVLVLLFLGYGLFVGFEGDASDDDRARLITSAHLAEVYAAVPDASTGTFTRTRYIDASTELMYELETDTLYLMSQVSYATSARSARDAYAGLAMSATAGMMLNKNTTEQVHVGLRSWGDRSRWSTLLVDGGRRGHVFVGQRDRWTVMFIVGGMRFNDPADFADFLTQHLDRMTAGSL